LDEFGVVMWSVIPARDDRLVWGICRIKPKWWETNLPQYRSVHLKSP